MATTPPLRLTPEWDDRFARMVVVSALAHLLAIAGVVLVVSRAADRPLPMAAYTVELTDPSALGGRLPPGPPAAQLGAAEHPPAVEPKGQPPEATKPPEPKAEARPVPPPKPQEPVVRIPDKTKPPEPKPPEPKAEAPKPEPAKPEAKKPEPPKPEPPRAEEKQPPKPTPKAADAQAKAAETKPAPRAGAPSGAEDATPRDAYGAAAERWRARGGGGLGGTDTESGPIGAGGTGKGGGGQVVGLEFLAYRQLVIQTIKSQWANVIARPGLVAAVRFEIATDGGVSNVRLAQSSGNPAYDASALRAVQNTSHLPAPPGRYANDFRDFLIEFHSEETGGRGAG
jgi:TonB family protein